MKAIRIHQFGGPDVLKLDELSDPAPGPGQVVVEIKAAGVNPVDTYIRSGIYGPRPFPYTLGMDAAGTVKAIGPHIKAVRPGDRVYLQGASAGTYATHATVEASSVHPLPPSLSFSQGAAIGVPYTTAYYALFERGRARPGETVFIHGASGGVGTAALQLARARGLRVIGTGGTEKGRALVKEQGAHDVLDHRAPDYLERLMRLTDGRGADLIVEMLANVNLAKDLTVLAPRGRVVVVGSRGSIEIDPRQTMSRNTDIRGMSLLNIGADELRGTMAALDAGFESGTLKPVVGRELPLHEAAKAHEEILAPGAYGKIVLIP